LQARKIKGANGPMTGFEEGQNSGSDQKCGCAASGVC
jgi:hypothetical protein